MREKRLLDKGKDARVVPITSLSGGAPRGNEGEADSGGKRLYPDRAEPLEEERIKRRGGQWV
ncbi:MAG: hypothetical protein JRJ26_16335 [Deltaproteobacteria bacterium]|nr:hypothetical protein [Deltaproteobacteria bacterium]